MEGRQSWVEDRHYLGEDTEKLMKEPLWRLPILPLALVKGSDLEI